MQITQLLDKIKQRPAMYLGKKSILSLKNFLDGYYFALMENGMSNEEEIDLWRDFQKYIELKYQINSSQNWSSIILFFSEDESEALEQFFILFEEFSKT